MGTQRIDNILYGPKIDFPIDGKGLGRTIFENIVKYKDKIFQINATNNDQETYEQINRKFIRIALELRNRGVKEGDTVISCSGNSVNSILPACGALYLNAITATLDPSLSVRDCAHLVKMVNPKLVFVVENTVELIEETLKQADIDAEIIVMGSHDKYATLSDFLKQHADEDEFVAENPENPRDTSIIYFSSGATGMPKGICISHFAALNATYALKESAIDLSITLNYASLYWISAKMILISTILSGGTRLVTPDFKPETFLKYVDDYKVTFSFLGTTYILHFNNENTENYKLENLKEIRIGGSAISADRMRKLSEYFPNTGIFALYGQSECGITSSFTKDSRALSKVKFGSSGVPFINIQLKIVDLETGKVLGPNQKGQVYIKSNTLLSKYFDQSDEDPFDADGFLQSGDVGYYDEDNCLYICDRIKDMFKYRDWHIVPASVETIIYEHPAVLETIVIGIPHEFDGHHPLALVILKNGSCVIEEDLLKFINGRVLDREKLRAGLKIVKRFPRTATGKIPRYVVRQMVLMGDFTTLNGD